MLSQTAFQLRGIALHPAPHGHVISGQTQLFQQLFDIAIGKRVAEVPTHSGDNLLWLKLPPLKLRRPGFSHSHHPTSIAQRKVATLPLAAMRTGYLRDRNPPKE